MDLRQVKSLLAAGRLDHLVAPSAQELGGDATDSVLVLDKQDASGAGQVSGRRPGRSCRRERCHHRHMHRQKDPEGSALARSRLHPDPAVGLLHDTIDRRQAEACPLPNWLGREEGIEDLVQDIGRNTGAVVRDLDHGLLALRIRISQRLSLRRAHAGGADLYG